MKNLLLFLVATLLSSQAYAKTEQFTLKANTAYGEEGIFFKTNKGNVSLNMYALPEKVMNSLHKSNLNKGACIEVNSSNGFGNDDGDGIKSIKNCTKTKKK